MMNGITLQILRAYLFFSIPEAAAMIGNVNERTWRYWESGQVGVPDEIVERIKHLLKFRNLVINELHVEMAKQGFNGDDMDSLVLTYYGSLDDWLTQEDVESILWRPHCSAMAAMAALGANLVKFDSVEYKKWLGDKEDNSNNRTAWATSVSH